MVPNIIDKASINNIPIYFTDLAQYNIFDIKPLTNILSTLITYSVPVFVFIFFVSLFNTAAMTTRMSQGNRRRSNINPMNNPFMIGMPEKKFDDGFIKPNISLSDWAGSPEVIDECKEVISYIDQKELYDSIGAEMPRGILLEGPPGTGKTLLAKAIATETNSSFLSMSGSEFVELFVGMGAARVRELFDKARENSPCIIFIDEIDAVGRQRGTGVNMANDEREQTLNQLLYEMDGFNNNTGIVILAATNRRDVLDQALLRPGRFDRIIRIPLPDKESRSKILDFYIQSKKTTNQFNVSAIAELTDGFSGAQLKNLINEAAILAIRQNRSVIEERFVFDAFEKLIVGLVKQNKYIPEITRLRVAIHESGHTLMVLLSNYYYDFQKASIQPTYNGAGGYTIFTEKPDIKESGLYTKIILKKRLVIMLGGKAAESIFYGDENVSSGAFDDLRQANKLAQRMIGNFGMGKELEVFFNDNINDESNPFLGRTLAIGDKYSEYTKTISDKESLELVIDAYQTAKSLIITHYDKLLHISNKLLNSTVITMNDIDFILEDN